MGLPFTGSYGDMPFWIEEVTNAFIDEFNKFESERAKQKMQEAKQGKS